MPNFSNIEQRVNQALNTKLANATADFGLASLVEGTFGNEYAIAIGLIEGNEPVFTCLDADIVGVKNRTALSIDYRFETKAYTVGSIHRDGTGMSLLVLEAV